jgi:hypothetical protein
MGRPSKLTSEVADRIISSIKSGNFRNTAARWAGIGERTMRDWMTRGEAHPKSPFGSFRRRVMEAEKAAEMRCVAIVMKAAANDAKHAEWWLERKYPQRWGRKQRHEITGKNGEVLRHQVEGLDPVEALADPELRGLLDAVADRAAQLASTKPTKNGPTKNSQEKP